MLLQKLTKNLGHLVVASILLGAVACYADNIAEPSADLSKASNDLLKRSLDLGDPLSSFVQEHLRLGEFDTLEAECQMMLDHYQADVAYESPLKKGFDAFRPQPNISIRDLDAWVDATGSGIAYAARGIYRAGEGFDIRGMKYVSQTPRANISTMATLHKQAFEDLMTAVELNPKLTPAWTVLLEISMASRLPLTPDEVYRKAIANDNRSFYLRGQYMSSLKPRWGGSYSAMNNFIKEILNDVALNPRVYSLLGSVMADQANLLGARGELSEAIQLYTKALQYGDKLGLLRERSNCLSRNGQHDEAGKDLQAILSYTPNDRYALGRLLYERQQLALNEPASN